MSMKIVRTSLASLAAVFALAFAGFANGALFGSHYDPLAFIGDALFQFDDGCLADGTYTGSPPCNAQLLSATFDMSDGIPGDVAHFDFSAVLPSSLINSFVVSGGQLVGVNTDPIGPDFAQSCPFAGCVGPWWIQWIYNPGDPSQNLLASNEVVLYTGECFSDLTDGSVLSTKSVSLDSVDSCSRNEQTSAVATDVTFSRVPEPGTMLLLVAGLLAAGIVRRRTSSRHDS
jgi:PEP-CTERM motif-containing protein